MKRAIPDLMQRRPVWEALSELFLDTDPSLSRQWRVDKLAASPYSVAELEQILIDEVYPICRSNLWSVAGAWARFDLQWLEERILQRLRSPLRRLHWFHLGRFIVPHSTEWRLTKQAVEAQRQYSSIPPEGSTAQNTPPV